MSRITHIAAFVIATLLGLWFLLAGLQKFLSADMFEDMFAQLGLPLGLVPVVGVAEIVAAVCVLVPKTRLYGAILVVFVMLGAIVSHVVSGMGAPAAAIVALAVALTVVFLRHLTNRIGLAGAAE